MVFWKDPKSPILGIIPSSVRIDFLIKAKILNPFCFINLDNETNSGDILWCCEPTNHHRPM